jgi:hypothetical protein
MSKTVPSKKSWIDIIDESVHTRDDVDIGDIDAVNRDFLVVKRGFVNVHYYYIPLSKVEGWDGNVLWLKITEDEVKRNYERNMVPEPQRYFVKDNPGYVAAYPELPVIAPEYNTMPVYTAMSQAEQQPVVLKCDLCETTFRSEDELSAHVSSKH